MRAVFLDRDGVINRAIVRDGRPYPPATLKSFELLPGVKRTAQALRKAEFRIIVVTNQPDVSTGVQQLEVVESMHQYLLTEGICDAVKVCYHIDEDNCNCRKPKPGMLFDAAHEWQLDLSKSYMVGDRWRDVVAGKAAGCYTFFIDYQYLEPNADKPDSVVTSLEEAGEQILKNL